MTAAVKPAAAVLVTQSRAGSLRNALIHSLSGLRMKSKAPVSASSAMANMKIEKWQPRNAITPTTNCVSDQAVRSELPVGVTNRATMLSTTTAADVPIMIHAQRGNRLSQTSACDGAGCGAGCSSSSQ